MVRRNLFGAWGLEFGAWGSGFRVQGLGFGVSGFGRSRSGPARRTGSKIADVGDCKEVSRTQG